MYQLILSIVPLIYAGYAQWKLKQPIPKLPSQPIVTKVKIGFQLQIVFLQAVELLISIYESSFITSWGNITLIIGLLHSFGITIQFNEEPRLIILPILLLFNLCVNPGILRIFDGLSLLLSLLLLIYCWIRKPYQINSTSNFYTFIGFMCDYLESENSIFAQYVLLLKFQPASYYEEIELQALKNDDIEQNLLHYESESNLSRKELKQIEFIQVEKQLNNKIQEEKQQLILLEKLKTELILNENFNNSDIQNSKASLKRQPDQELEQKYEQQQQQQQQQQYQYSAFEFVKEEETKCEKAQEQIIELSDKGSSQQFDLIEEPKQQESLVKQIDKIQKKKRDIKLIAKKNKMLKRIKSQDEFTQAIQEKIEHSYVDNDDRSDFDRYKDEINSSVISDDECDSCTYLAQKIEKIYFKVEQQIVKKIINSQPKHYIKIYISLDQKTWSKLCLYGELIELSLHKLPEAEYTEGEQERRVTQIQVWLDQLTQNPFLMTLDILQYFEVPESTINKYNLVQKIQEEKQSSVQQELVQLGPLRKLQQQPTYFQKIKSIKADCYSFERSYAMDNVVYFNIRFTINLEHQTLTSECQRTIEELKETSNIIKRERNLSFQLQQHETSKSQMKAINDFMQELFNHSFYYCDPLFESFGILELIRKQRN